MSAILRRLTRLVGRISLLVILSLTLSFDSNAQLIGTWNFTGNTAGIAGTDNSVSAADFSVSVPTRAFNGGTEYFGENGWPSAGINTSYYMQFTLTPNSGHFLSIFSVVLRMRRSNTGSPSGSGPTSWGIRSSLDGYSTDISSGTMNHNYSNHSVLPGGGFGAIYTPVTFRVYGFDASVSTGGNSRMVFDYIQVTGMGPLLPVHLISFAGRVNAGSVQLDYSLANTEPGTKYQLERSVNGSDYIPVNNRTETQTQDRVSYQYTDIALPPGYRQFYYRLGLTNTGGGTIYSSIIVVSLNSNSKPLQAKINGQSLTLYGELMGQEDIDVFNSSGVCVLKSALHTSSGFQVLSLSLPALAKGIYYVRVGNGRQAQVLKVLSE